MEKRPDPDVLLAQVQAEESQRARGKLKIFLGYAAGVGKTFAMLDAAHRRKVEGVEVVIGYVETHKRAETEALLQDLETIPRKYIQHRGIPVPEMDVDKVLTRRPQLALVDELAHTNAPDSRHAKRYQDVEELLAAGIDVYTTLNIQHLESLNDIVAQITGIVVRETIPDRVLDEASEIEVVDLPPGELQQRLKEGKVYVPEQVAHAIQRFFRQGNLTALREIALRRAAERVDDQMLAYMQTRAIAGPWPARERLLVLVSPGTRSERMVRTARRLADELDAEWFALYVEPPAPAGPPPAAREQAARALEFADELGAKAVTLVGSDVVETALAYAQTHNITKVIAGKPLGPRWREFLRGSIVDQLVRKSGPIDVYVISHEPAEHPPRSPASWAPHRPYRRYLQSLLLVVAATILGFLLDLPLTLEKWRLLENLLAAGARPAVEPAVQRALEPTNLAMIYLAAVVVAALYLGRGPALLASVLSVIAFDFLFVPPYLTFAVSDTQYILTFVGLFVVGIVMSTLALRARGQAEAAQRREVETAELYDLSRDLAAAGELGVILEVLTRHVVQTFGREAAILLPEQNLLHVRAGVDLGQDELAVADWVFRHGEPAGYSTDTLPAAELHYMPLKGARGVVGVLGLGRPESEEGTLRPERLRLMEAYASQAALAIERALLADQAGRAELLEAAERLQTALLNSISHDLRTPLVTITGTLTSLAEDGGRMDEGTLRSLVDNARAEADRLNRLVGNLLDMTRLEAGAMRIRREPCDVQEVIGAALDQADAQLAGRSLTVDVPQSIPLVPMDFVLIVQVLVNLLDNAVKYSDPEGPIEVRARAAGPNLEITVADRGIGIPPEDLERVFEKFYRVQRPDSVGGTGLGLSIGKGIVEAHGGSIRAANRAGGGTSVRMQLPLAE
jgi:two-component system sensor histidine kinase KdpD